MKDTEEFAEAIDSVDHRAAVRELLFQFVPREAREKITAGFHEHIRNLEHIRTQRRIFAQLAARPRQWGTDIPI